MYEKSINLKLVLSTYFPFVLMTFFFAYIIYFDPNHKVLANIKGDKAIWAGAALLALFSFLPVYSASSNLAYLYGGNGDTFSFLVKHFAHLVLGFLIM